MSQNRVPHPIVPVRDRNRRSQLTGCWGGGGGNTRPFRGSARRNRLSLEIVTPGQQNQDSDRLVGGSVSRNTLMRLYSIQTELRIHLDTGDTGIRSQPGVVIHNSLCTIGRPKRPTRLVRESNQYNQSVHPYPSVKFPLRVRQFSNPERIPLAARENLHAGGSWQS